MHPIAVVPLISSQEGDEARWLGALLARLLAQFLQGSGLPVVSYNDLASYLAEQKVMLPLNAPAAQAIQQSLRLSALIHGRYTLDEEGKMLSLQLIIEAPELPPVPLEASSPLAGFGRFIERVALALIEQLRVPIDDSLREQVNRLPRPSSFEAFRQLARAQAAWSRGQNELALASVTSALSLDADLEEAAALEVAIARAAGDTATTREAFRRWSHIATRGQRPLVAAERLLMLGHWLAAHAEWDDARRAYEDARAIFQKEQDDYRLSQTLNNLANLELVRENYQEAIQVYRRTLRTFESEEGGEPDAASTLHNLALAHRGLGQQEEAERAIEQALALARRIQDTYLEARCLAQRGTIYADTGRWMRAEADYTQAARLLDVLGDDAAVAVVQCHQAILLKQQGAYERAERLMIQALRNLERLNVPHEQAILWLNLAGLYLAMGDYGRAWDYGERAHETLVRLKSAWADRARDLLDALASISEVAGESEEAPPALPPSPAAPGSSNTTLRPAPDATSGLAPNDVDNSPLPRDFEHPADTKPSQPD